MQSAAGDTHADLRLTLLERQVTDLAATIEALRHILPPATGLPETLHLSADDIASFGVGFHPREFDEAGTPFRWTGRGDFFELRAMLDRSVPRQLELRLRAPRIEALEPVSVFIDYAEVAADLSNGGADHRLRCILPAAAGGRVVVTVYAPNTTLHEGSVPAQSGHKVGVMFFAAVVGPVANPLAGEQRHV